MEKTEDLEFKSKKTQRKFLPKAINLLLKEEKIEGWEKTIRVAKTIAFIITLVFLVVLLSVLLYFWRLSAYGVSLEKRADQAREKIVSLKEIEKTYLSLIKKVVGAEKVISSTGAVLTFLEATDRLLPGEIPPKGFSIEKKGEVVVQLPLLSLEELENLDNRLKEAIREEKLVVARYGGVTKVEDGYQIDLSFQVKKQEE